MNHANALCKQCESLDFCNLLIGPYRCIAQRKYALACLNHEDTHLLCSTYPGPSSVCLSLRLFCAINKYYIYIYIKVLYPGSTQTVLNTLVWSIWYNWWSEIFRIHQHFIWQICFMGTGDLPPNPLKQALNYNTRTQIHITSVQSEQIPAKQHTHCSPRLDQLISLYSHVIPHERLILHVLLFIVLYWCDMYLCTSVVIQCLFQWIGRQVTCPHETDLSNKVLMYPGNFWSSIVYIYIIRDFQFTKHPVLNPFMKHQFTEYIYIIYIYILRSILTGDAICCSYL